MKRLTLSLCLLILSAGSAHAQPSREEAIAAMKRATTFMVERASLRGGYVWNLSEDLTKRWGEVPARPSQIWTQGGTHLAGLAFLDAYDATGDRLFLDAARRAADALIFGQLEDGGWHYFIDFDPAGLDEWYRDSASKYTYGYEEYRYYYGNATNDDQVTSDCARFLLRYYKTTLEPAYRTPVLKALDFVLKAQYPNGGWPQRYPLRFDFAHDGLPDYTSYYTLNDGAHQGYVELLLRAYRALGDRRYLDAARRGADFLLISQGPDGEAGWAEQFGPDLKPIAARAHEPSGYVIRESRDALRVLQLFYALTEDARYLAPIPRCLAWFERVNKEAVELKRPPARYYQVGTNRPVYVLRVPQKNAEGYGLYSWTHEPPASMEVRRPVDVAPIRRDYESVILLKTPESRAAYVASYLDGPSRDATPTTADIATLIERLDSRGAWVTDVRVHQEEPTPMHSGEGSPLRGISTGVFVRNLGLLTAYIAGSTKLSP